MTRMITYVDGFNLYFGMKSRGWRRYYWLDLCLMAENLLRPGQQLLETKYFTSRISATPSDPQKARRQVAYLEALQTRPNLRIFFGHYLQNPIECRRCGASWLGHEEKMTDVNIATEMLTDAFDDRFETAVLVTADSDLTRPIEVVRGRFPAKRVVLAFPPNRFSERLKQVGSAYFTIGRDALAASQLPDRVVKASGFVLHRPAEWTWVLIRPSLKKRTLTNLYNQQPTWLDQAHQKLDAAVSAAYGWDPGMSDESILEKLLELNLARAGGER
jgi:uncharacterized LabA/DUF88 family protein